MHTQKFENLSVSYHIFIQSQKNAIKEKGQKYDYFQKLLKLEKFSNWWYTRESIQRTKYNYLFFSSLSSCW